MAFRSNVRGRCPSGFTLIELLVVVAIIALLISILLPALSGARAQGRTAVCASRIAQLAKAIFMYADDYDETPPFIGLGFENLLNDLHKEFPAGSGLTRGYWASHETWLIPEIPTIWNQLEEDWDDLTGGRAKVRNGSLFGYTRFEDLYRCPDFERVPSKNQGAFNYTRTVMGRKPLSGGIPGDGLEDPDDLEPGPILKISNIYATGSMFMLLDEQWDFHVAGNYNGDPPQGIIELEGNDFWMGADSIHMLIADCIGDYHGTTGKDVPIGLILPAKKGNIAYYDGHVQLMRDPLPQRVLNADIDEIINNPDLVEQGIQLLSPFIRQIFAARGLGVDIMDVISWFL